MKHAIYDHFGAQEVATPFDQPISEQIWMAKYKYRSQGGDIDHDLGDTLRRVAAGLAEAEAAEDRQRYSTEFLNAMQGFKLIPAGRILSGCGTARNVTLSNTFVMRAMPDSVSGIMDTIKDAALTMQMGGGLGFDFSTLRPKGTVVRGLDCPAAGPLAAMDVCDSVCKMLVTGMGRGAMMATLRCDHPDIEAFVTAKSDPNRMRNFNTSVMVTDRFMRAVQDDAGWDLIWNNEVMRQIGARALWQMIMTQTYTAAEPGVLFIDRINALNPLSYLETISATNSCAEQPLPPNGTCPLASINLSRLVRDPFGSNASFDTDELRHLVGIGVRMLDNAIDVSRFAVPAQRREAQDKRRIGLGVTGVGDALIMLGARYGSHYAVDQVGAWMQTIQNAAYMASAKLAAERGSFPLFDAEKHLAQPVVRALDATTRDQIARDGLRNGTLTTIAPTGTISMFAGNVSSGIEPVFATSYNRKIIGADGAQSEERVEDYAAWLFHQTYGRSASLPDAFVTAMDLGPEEHVRMQAAAQRWVDSGISKTVNCPEDLSFADFEHVYLAAYSSGCKGCTTYRPNALIGSVLST